MSETSIFSGVVKSENAHTQLLCNLMEESEEFRRAVLKFLLRDDVESFHRAATIQSQASDAENGQPDIRISFEGSNRGDLIVEVKAKKDCRATERQVAEVGQPGYSNLGQVIFLVPQDWRYRNCVQGGIRLWNDLPSFLDKEVPELRDNPLLREYRSFLAGEFPSVRFSPSQVKMITNGTEKEVVEIARKLHVTVDKLKKNLTESPVGNTTVSRKPDSSNTEYGYYVQSGERNLLWFGMWSPPSLLLGAAYKGEWLRNQHIEGFAPFKDDWNILSLNDVLSSTDPIGEAETRLRAILESILARK